MVAAVSNAVVGIASRCERCVVQPHAITVDIVADEVELLLGTVVSVVGKVVHEQEYGAAGIAQGEVTGTLGHVIAVFLPVVVYIDGRRIELLEAVVVVVGGGVVHVHPFRVVCDTFGPERYGLRAAVQTRRYQPVVVLSGPVARS